MGTPVEASEVGARGGCRTGQPEGGTAEGPPGALSEGRRPEPLPSTRRPADSKRTWELREMYLQISSALEAFEIETKMAKCAVRWGRCEDCRGDHFQALKCRSRLCPFEARLLARMRVGVYEGRVQSSKNPRFLTLTRPLIPYTSSLLEGLRELRAAWNRLLHRKVFGLVKGGVYAIEIVLRPQGFHVHMHILMDCSWVENRNEHGRPLEAAWKECLEGVGVKVTGGRYKRAVVEILRCNRKTLREVLKYSVKGAASKKQADGNDSADGHRTLLDTGQKIRIPPQLAWSEVPQAGLVQLVQVLEGRTHLLEPFGAWRGDISRWRKADQAEAREQAASRDVCQDCGGRLVIMSTMPWADPRLVFVGGQMSTTGPPPGLQDAA